MNLLAGLLEFAGYLVYIQMGLLEVRKVLEEFRFQSPFGDLNPRLDSVLFCSKGYKAIGVVGDILHSNVNNREFKSPDGWKEWNVHECLLHLL